LDDNVWSPQQRIPNVGTSHSPALAGFRNTLCMAWKGAGTSTVLATSLFASALIATASGSFSQPLPGKNSPDASSQDKKRLERFEKQVDVLRNLLHIPGMSAAIVKNQQVLWAKGFGFADLENRTPVTPDTVFHLASITKTFAATLILQLVEQGKL